MRMVRRSRRRRRLWATDRRRVARPPVERLISAPRARNRSSLGVALPRTWFAGLGARPGRSRPATTDERNNRRWCWGGHWSCPQRKAAKEQLTVRFSKLNLAAFVQSSLVGIEFTHSGEPAPGTGPIANPLCPRSGSYDATVPDRSERPLARRGSVWNLLVGRPLRTSETSKEEITPVEGLSALSVDALTSVAYGPEAIIVVLGVAGAGALHEVLPITVAIVVLLGILVFSYRQVIDAYPGGGGAYAVSRANLGSGTSLVAGASLVVDSTLTVAVSIAAGVGALTSAFPSLS